jgi:ankyrin repeat protein
MKPTIKVTILLWANTQRTDNGQSPIFAAAFRGDHRIVELLANLPSVDVNASDVSGRTPLMVATSSGFTSITRELERRGGLLRDPNRASVGDNMWNIVSMQRKEKRERAANERKKVAQFAQAVRAGDVNFVRTLLNEDVDPPPLVLHLACANRRADVAFALARPIIETGKTDINAGGETSGFTPLYIACAHGHDALVRFLIVQPHMQHRRYSP